MGDAAEGMKKAWSVSHIAPYESSAEKGILNANASNKLKYENFRTILILELIGQLILDALLIEEVKYGNSKSNKMGSDAIPSLLDHQGLGLKTDMEVPALSATRVRYHGIAIINRMLLPGPWKTLFMQVITKNLPVLWFIGKMDQRYIHSPVCRTVATDAQSAYENYTWNYPYDSFSEFLTTHHELFDKAFAAQGQRASNKDYEVT
jgi:hypothetical protein